MTTTSKVVSAGVTLALVLQAATANAQTHLASPQPSGASAPAQAPSAARQRTPEDIARNRAIADQYNLPPDILTHREDDYGRPVPRTVEDTIRELGVEGARLAAQDDADFCVGLDEIDQMKLQVQAADAEVALASQAVAEARTRADRAVAEARLGRARNNLFQLLLTGLRLGLAVAIPGAGWAYGGYIVSSEAANFLSRNQHNRELRATDALNDLFLAQSTENTLRLRALDRRNEIYDRRGELWDRSMKGWCGVMRPYFARMTTVTSSYTPAISAAQ
ncbi:MAG: hypothetical protein V4644_01470 [Patescibacteria group bacterium]